MVMSGDQNAGRIHSVRIDNNTFERMEEFKYFGTTFVRAVWFRIHKGLIEMFLFG